MNIQFFGLCITLFGLLFFAECSKYSTYDKGYEAAWEDERAWCCATNQEKKMVMKMGLMMLRCMMKTTYVGMINENI